MISVSETLQKAGFKDVKTRFLVQEQGRTAVWTEQVPAHPHDQLSQIIARAFVFVSIEGVERTVYLETQTSNLNHPGLVEPMQDSPKVEEVATVPNSDFFAFLLSMSMREFQGSALEKLINELF
jgi:hypothetical protein